MSAPPVEKRSLVPDNVARLKPYVPGRTEAEIKAEHGIEDVIKLASNENALGPSVQALRAMSTSLDRCHRYPSADDSPLRVALARRFGVKEANVVLGSGSESIMACIVRAFLHDDDETLTAEGAFLGFDVLVRSRGVPVVRVPLDRDGYYRLDALADHISRTTKLVYVANPNNPTGTYVRAAEFERFMERVPDHVLVIWDEAYFEYAQSRADYPDSMRYRMDNVITLRTFSKAYGLAGVRLGYGLAHEDLITNIRKVRLPFEPSVPALAAGMGALSDTDHLAQTVELNTSERGRVTLELKRMGLRPLDSAANFVMVPCDGPEQAFARVKALERRGVIVRHLGPFGFDYAFRVTVGRPDENDTFLDALRAVIADPAGP